MCRSRGSGQEKHVRSSPDSLHITCPGFHGQSPAWKKDPGHLFTGRRGEEEAYFHLRQLGYVMVARNYRSARSRSELDLVAWDDATLCFIEVKTRTTRAIQAG